MTLWASSLLIAQMFFFQQEKNACVHGEITPAAPERGAQLLCQGRAQQARWAHVEFGTYRGWREGYVHVCREVFFKGKAIYSVACKGKKDVK